MIVPPDAINRLISTSDILKLSSDLTKRIDKSIIKELSTGAPVWWLGNPVNKWPIAVSKGLLNGLISMTKADIFIALQDIFLFEHGPFACYSIVWMPLHFVPLEHKTLMSLADFDRIVCMTRYGQDLLNLSFGDCKPLDYIPHARSATTFSPSPSHEARMAVRRRLGWPEDAFVTFMVAANAEASNRKAFDAQLHGWCKFAQMCDRLSPPKKVFLYIHSNPFGEADLPRLLEIFGEFHDRVYWMDPTSASGHGTTKYLEAARKHSEDLFGSELASRIMPKVQLVGLHEDGPRTSPLIRTERVAINGTSGFGDPLDSDMVEMYRAADVLLASACAEGFGVPILEAQLCGTPVVTNRYTAMPELTQLGISVKPKCWIIRADFDSGWYHPDEDGIARALMTIAQWRPEDLAARRTRALRVLTKRYDDPVVFAAWQDLMTIIKPKVPLVTKVTKHDVKDLITKPAKATKPSSAGKERLTVSKSTVPKAPRGFPKGPSKRKTTFVSHETAERCKLGPFERTDVCEIEENFEVNAHRKLALHVAVNGLKNESSVELVRSINLKQSQQLEIEKRLAQVKTDIEIMSMLLAKYKVSSD
jgi:glycosyltransferase involved in cell wall biosynthesis